MMRTLNLVAVCLLSAVWSSLTFANIVASNSTIDAILSNGSFRTTRQNPIPLIRIEMHKAKAQPVSLNAVVKPYRSFLIQGGLHGDEVMTTEFVEWLAVRTKNGESLLNQLPEGTVIDFIPSANPDNYRKSRYNHNSINLNRNFGILWGVSREPFGEMAFSEPETRAIRALMRKQKYLAAVDVHGYINWVVAPSHPHNVPSAKPEQRSRFMRWFETLRKNLAVLGQYELKTAASLGDGGAFEDWAFWGNNSLAFCLEMQTRRRFIGERGDNLDSFKRYEQYIQKMFLDAIEIQKREQPTPSLSQFASQP